MLKIVNFLRLEFIIYMSSTGDDHMGWKRVLALALVVLFLGMTVSGAGATASFVNATVNNTVAVPQGFNLKKGPEDAIQPENAGANIIVDEFFGTFVPGVGWVVFLGGILLEISKYLYSKPVREFTESFYKKSSQPEFHTTDRNWRKALR